MISKKQVKNKNILLGVCSSIAIYKSCELIRLLTKDSFSVKVVMTEAATKLISPLLFKELSRNPVYTDMFDLKEEDTKHISLSMWADVCVIAPVSANTISKIANGICDNLLTTLVCALKDKKIILAPAMNENMWRNPIIQENVEKLKRFKNYIILGPEKGRLLCGVYGEGKMVDVEEIYKCIKKI